MPLSSTSTGGCSPTRIRLAGPPRRSQSSTTSIIISSGGSLMRRASAWATAMGVVATTLTVSTQTANVERGKYLVEEIARCQECHTPRTETGEFDRSRCCLLYTSDAADE